MVFPWCFMYLSPQSRLISTRCLRQLWDVDDVWWGVMAVGTQNSWRNEATPATHHSAILSVSHHSSQISQDALPILANLSHHAYDELAVAFFFQRTPCQSVAWCHMEIHGVESVKLPNSLLLWRTNAATTLKCSPQTVKAKRSKQKPEVLENLECTIDRVASQKN